MYGSIVRDRGRSSPGHTAIHTIILYSLSYSLNVDNLKVLNHASRTLPRLLYTNLKKGHTEKKAGY